MSLLFISQEDTLKILDMSQTMKVVEDVFKLEPAQITWPDPRMFRMKVPEFGGNYHVKGICLHNFPVSGVRVVGYRKYADGSGTSAPHTMRFVILQDPETGSPLAIMDEHWNYSLRTAASGCVAAKYLARKESRVAGVIGVGNIGLAALLGIDELFDLDCIKVTSRRPQTREAFVKKVQDQVRAKVVAVESAEEVARDSDIVMTCTTARTPVVKWEWLRRGSFVCGYGEGEIDPLIYKQASKVVVDDWELTRPLHDIQELLKGGYLTEERVYAEIADVVKGTKPARDSDEEIIVTRTQGLVTQDVAVAYHVYKEARSRGFGIELPWAPIQKD